MCTVHRTVCTVRMHRASHVLPLHLCVPQGLAIAVEATEVLKETFLIGFDVFVLLIDVLKGSFQKDSMFKWYTHHHTHCHTHRHTHSHPQTHPLTSTDTPTQIHTPEGTPTDTHTHTHTSQTHPLTSTDTPTDTPT